MTPAGCTSLTVCRILAARQVDIDTIASASSPVRLEKELIEAIADTPALASRVDELFFEYHIWVDEETRHTLGPQQLLHFSNDTGVQAIRFMQRLRELGIRSHFWV